MSPSHPLRVAFLVLTLTAMAACTSVDLKDPAKIEKLKRGEGEKTRPAVKVLPVSARRFRLPLRLATIPVSE